MAYAIEDLVNMALDEIGYSKHVGDIYEGSPAARVALEIYGQSRDELLQMGEWPFAQREVVLTVVGGQTAPTPWVYEFNYPADCLRIKYIRPGPLTGGTINNDPQPVLFRPWNDQRPGTPIRAILCSLASPVLIYIGKVTDPGTWPPEFIKALVRHLAEQMAFMLPQSPETTKAAIALSQRAASDAMSVDDTSPPKAGMQVNGQ